MSVVSRTSPVEVPVLDLTDLRDVVVCAPDGHGRLMGKTIRAADWPSISRSGLSMPDFHLATDLTNAIQDGLQVTGSHTGFPNGLLLPDPTTVHRLPWRPDTALVLADVADADGKLVSEAPRQVLRRQVERLQEHGLSVSVATELELYVFEEPPAVAAGRRFSALTPLAHRQGDHDILVAEQFEPFLTELRRLMRELGAPVISSLAEGGVGQLEVNFDHGPPLAVADIHVLFKYVCKALASRQGRSVTFMAKWHHEQPGSSGHVHLSLRDHATGEPEDEGAIDRGQPPHRPEVDLELSGPVLLDHVSQLDPGVAEPALKRREHRRRLAMAHLVERLHVRRGGHELSLLVAPEASRRSTSR
jgi:glutamine synthetase